jgi:phosphohistidine phosphatase
MKTLYLVRHAKSSWEDLSLQDFDRPLNKRGKENAPFMGKLLKKKNIKVDWILSSPALRAKKTIEMIAGELDYLLENIIFEKKIYEASTSYLMQLIQNQDDKIDGLLICGHNPELTILVNQLTTHEIENIPTSGVCCIEFDTNQWEKIRLRQNKLVFFEYPKKYK